MNDTNSTLRMLLLMSLATGLYVLVSAVLWHLWQKKAKHTLLEKAALGLIYGLCSIASNHLAIDYNTMLLNVRDIGPLAAGLFFSPLAGVMSGLIGGVERFIIGEYYNIGSFTRVACSISTGLAGIVAAMLKKWIYKEEQPSMLHAFFLGAMVESFHMYVVLITHRDAMYMATYIVQTCSPPMISFTSAGMAVIAGVVLLMIKRKHRETIHLRTPREKTPLSLRFQRWLLCVMLLMFVLSTAVSYSFQTSMSEEQAIMNMQFAMVQYQSGYENTADVDAFNTQLVKKVQDTDIYYMLVDYYNNICVSSSMDGEPTPVEPSDLAHIIKHADEGAYHHAVDTLFGMDCICISTRLDHRYYLMLCSLTSSIFNFRDSQMYENLFSDITLFTVMFILISLLVEKLVVRNLESVNASLARITEGHLDEVVSVREASEFVALSTDINHTVTALRGYIDAAEKRMEEELKLAAAIQEAALPRNFTFPRKDFEIYALMDPARQVGGDFYDMFFIDRNLLALVIADVSGKGVPGALFMMRSKTAIKNLARADVSPAELLSGVNDILCEGNDAEMFVTVWLGIVDLTTGSMRCANAGHEYPVLMHAGGAYELVKDKHGMVLAAMEGMPMREYELQLSPGDRLFVYTDGVPEAINEKEEAYGVQRLVDRLNTLREAPQEQTLKETLEDIRRFAGEAEQFDDITMIGFTYNGPET